MRRVVVTGLGIVSSIGNNAEEVTESLRNARSGIRRRAGGLVCVFALVGALSVNIWEEFPFNFVMAVTIGL